MAKTKNIPSPNEPFWDKETLCSEIIPSITSKFTVCICFKEGKKFISISRWYCTKKNSEWKPKTGIVFPYDSASEIVKALEVAILKGDNAEFESLL